MNKNEDPVVLSKEEVADMIWKALQEWLDSGEPLPPEVKHHFVDRAVDLRIKMQAILMEIQRRVVKELSLNIEFETELRRAIRTDLPYMSPVEKFNALKALRSADEDHLSRLESQMAGLDFFDTIRTSVYTLNDTKVSRGLVEQVRRLPSKRRQELRGVLAGLIDEIEATQQAESEDGKDSIKA